MGPTRNLREYYGANGGSQPCQSTRLHSSEPRLPVRIITRYVLKEHLGPLVFALAALTSLLMLQYVARQLGNLVGKGLPWRIIGEFFVLSLPFTVAMTMPMAVLVATLHAFGRMASENEITAFKATGVRVTTLMAPVLIGAAFLALGMVAFNDQVLPRANHKLRMLTQDMSRAKPTLALSEQVLNQVTNGFYMRIGRLDRESNRMTDVTLYDLSDPQNRKTIYADSGDLSFTPDKKDLQLVLFNGYQQELRGNNQHGLQRSYFRTQAVRIKDIGGDFEQSGADTWKGDREKSICEMQSEYVVNARDYERVRQMYIETASRAARPGQKMIVVPKARPATEGVARLYCNALALVFRMPTAQPTLGPTGFPITASTPPPSSPGGTPSTTLANGTAGTGQVPAGSAAPNSATLPAAAMTPAMQAQLAAAKAAIQAATQAPQIQAAPPPTSQLQAPNTAPTGQAPVIPTPAPAVTALLDSAKSQTVQAMPPKKGESASAPPTTTLPTTPVPKVPVSNSIANAAGVSPAVANAAVATGTANAAGAAGSGTTVGVPGAPAPIPGTTVPNLPPSAPVPALRVEKSNVSRPAPSATVVAPIPASTSGSLVMPAAGVAVVPPPTAGAPVTPGAQATTPTPVPTAGYVTPTIMPGTGAEAELAATTSQLSVVRASMDSLAVEVEKKFALSIACIVFVLFGPPIALRFPRGGVGATLGVSLVVFGLYYVCLMAGETLADDGKLPPWVAMWAANVIFTVLGLLLLLRIEKTADASRGGGIGAWWHDRKARRALRTAPAFSAPSSAPV
jgi:lipopolysaccharide export system permease protein